MAVLVLVEFDAAGIKQPSRSAVAAARALGEVHALIAGSGVADGAAAAIVQGSQASMPPRAPSPPLPPRNRRWDGTHRIHIQGS